MPRRQRRPKPPQTPSKCPKCERGNLVPDERPSRFGFDPVKCDACGGVFAESRPEQ